MMGFFEWFISDNNWVASTAFFLVCLLWSWVGVKSESKKVMKIITGLAIGGFIGIAMNFWMSYSAYHNYANHWKTCSKPEAVASFYVFDNERSVCLKPVVGFIPVDNKDIIEIKPTIVPEGELL